MMTLTRDNVMYRVIDKSYSLNVKTPMSSTTSVPHFLNNFVCVCVIIVRVLSGLNVRNSLFSVVWNAVKSDRVRLLPPNKKTSDIFERHTDVISCIHMQSRSRNAGHRQEWVYISENNLETIVGKLWSKNIQTNVYLLRLWWNIQGLTSLRLAISLKVEGCTVLYA